MRKKVGLWIDHRKAIIVSITDKGEETKKIVSNVDKQPGRSDGIRSTTSYESQLVPADDSRERKFTGNLNTYYDQIIECIHDAESIFIFGPGEAKGELEKRLEKGNLDSRIVGIETVDKMTDGQIAAKVRQYFQKK